MYDTKKRLKILKSLHEQGYRAGKGVLWLGKEIVCVLTVDQLAYQHGFMNAERLIRFMEGKE